MYTVLIIFFVFAISMSFLCSLWEAVLLSITPTYTQIKVKENHFLGKQLKNFKEQIDKPLSAILTLNTIAHTVGAIGVGEQASIIWGGTSPYVTKLIVPASMTLAILLLSEIIPKTIGANYWKRFVPFTVVSLTILIRLLYPLVWLCQLLTRLFPSHGAKNILTRNDFLALTAIGESHGIFEESEADLIEKTLDFYEINAREVMRPAHEMVSISKDSSIEQIYEIIKKHRYTRYPVYEGNKNKIVGIIHIKDLLTKEGVNSINEILRPIIKIQAKIPVNAVLKEFREGRPHFALVMKNKRVLGFLTLDNVLQVLLGIMKDEFHHTHVDWILNENGSIRAKGRCAIYSLEHQLDIDIEHDDSVETLAELIYENISHIPKENDLISFEDFDAVIEKMQGGVIISVLIQPKEKNPS